MSKFKKKGKIMECKKCKFKKSIPGDAHISCSRTRTQVYNVNQHGVSNGWFMFPFNFDPIWAEGCDGFVPQTLNLNQLSIPELLTLYKVEEARYKRNESNFVRTEESFNLVLKKMSEKLNDSDIGKSSVTELKTIIKELWEF
jgi:hypothetical protein